MLEARTTSPMEGNTDINLSSQVREPSHHKATASCWERNCSFQRKGQNQRVQGAIPQLRDPMDIHGARRETAAAVIGGNSRPQQMHSPH